MPQGTSNNIVAIKQKRVSGCAAACLEMVSTALGQRLSQELVISEMGGLKSYGLCTKRLAEFARSKGFSATCYSATQDLHFEFTADILKELLSPGSYLILTVDPQVLAGGVFSRKLHNIVLKSMSLELATYLDPKDGIEHDIAAEKLVQAWKIIAPKASVHTLVVRNLKSLMLK